MKAKETEVDARRRSRFAVAWLLVLPVGGYLFFQRVQTRIWNHLSWIDVVVMTALIAPFLASPWLQQLRSRATALAWWLCSLMALDVLAFAIQVLAPTGGHPSLEALASIWIGVGKVALVPAAVVCLVVAALRGERATTILLATICLTGETLYTLSIPDQQLGGWINWLHRASA